MLAHSRAERSADAQAALRWCSDPENLAPWVDIAVEAYELALEQREKATKPAEPAAEEESTKPAPTSDPIPAPAPPAPPPSKPADDAVPPPAGAA
jgi:hypothetical protein